MIIALRKAVKTKTFRIIFFIIILATSGIFSLFELSKGFFSKNTIEWILKIDNTAITVPEFTRVVADQQERIRLIRAQYGQYADLYFQLMGIPLNPQELALNVLIRRALLNKVANALPLYVDTQTAQTFLNNPSFISQEISDLIPLAAWDQSLGGINPLVLNSYLNHLGISQADFNAALVQAVKRDDVRHLVEHAGYTLDYEIKEKFIQNFLGHKFTITTIPASQILANAKKETVNDQSLKAYFDLKNSQEKRYSVPEKRTAKVATFDPTHYGIPVSNEEIETYYANNKAQFIDQPAQVQIRRILFKIPDAASGTNVEQTAQKVWQELLKNPQQFEQKAKELSQDEKSASQGGLLPYFTKGKHDKTFEKTAFLLKEDGAISSVIQTVDGFEILQRVGKKMQTFKPLERVSKDIKDTLTAKKFGKQFAADVRAVLNASNKQEALDAFIKEKKGKESLSKDLVANDSVLSKTAFRLKENETSFYQEPNQGVIVTTTEIKKGYIPDLQEIKKTVLEDYYKDRAAKNLEMYLEKIKKEKIPLEDIKDAEKLVKTGWLLAHDNKENQEKLELQKKGIDVTKMFHIEQPGGIETFEQNGNGFVIRLDEIAPFDQNLYDQKKADLHKELEQQKKSFIFAGFVASLYRNAHITKNELQLGKNI